MESELDRLQNKLNQIVSTLPKEIDRSWLVSAYLSLKKAERMKYKYDVISRLEKKQQDNILKQCTSFSAEGKSENIKNWIAGYYFNNAMLRMVALAEIGLKVLFEKKEKIEPPDDYWWLSTWYTKHTGNRLSTIQQARKRVNKLKHEKKQEKSKQKFETLRQGVSALKELLVLMGQLTRSSN
jgi:hypothetical protein